MRHPDSGAGQNASGARGLGGRLGLLGALTVMPLAFLPSPAAAVIAPIVQTSAPVAVSGGFELRGKIYTYESDTHYHFEYGTTTAYGTSVPVPDADAGIQSVVNVAQTVTGLQPSTTYHFRLFAENAGGPGMSADGTFNTAEAPTGNPPPQETPHEGGSPAPKGSKVRLKIKRVGGKRVLAAANGHTLYSLSAERKGKFICTKASGCTSLWTPLLVPSGGSVVGPVKLGSVKRPEGQRQATYRGLPLYTFVEDTKPGEANGEGFKDVGTWHAVKVPKQKHRRG